MHTNESKTPRIALIHDWLLTHRGGEQVLAALCRLFPTADIFTLLYLRQGVSPWIRAHRIRASYLNRLPGIQHYYRGLLPLFPSAIETLDVSDYDLVFSSSHCVAKGIIPAPDAVHLTYCHTPMRYIWDRSGDYLRSSFLRSIASPFLSQLRVWDIASSHRVDQFFANSHWVKDRIERYYRRTSEVIHPPVQLDTFRAFPLPDAPGEYYLCVSALVPYKKIEMAIGACERLGRRLIIVGRGTEERRLKRLARQHTRFVGRLSDSELSTAYRNARALLFPGEEDFGIAPVESMASGRPVIALGRGGILDSVEPGRTGVLYSDSSEEALCEAILDFEQQERSLLPEDCRAHAAKFSSEEFARRIRSATDRALRTRGRAPIFETNSSRSPARPDPG